MYGEITIHQWIVDEDASNYRYLYCLQQCYTTETHNAKKALTGPYITKWKTIKFAKAAAWYMNKTTNEQLQNAD